MSSARKMSAVRSGRGESRPPPRARRERAWQLRQQVAHVRLHRLLREEEAGSRSRGSRGRPRSVEEDLDLAGGRLLLPSSWSGPVNGMTSALPPFRAPRGDGIETPTLVRVAAQDLLALRSVHGAYLGPAPAPSLEGVGALRFWDFGVDRARCRRRRSARDGPLPFRILGQCGGIGPRRACTSRTPGRGRASPHRRSAGGGTPRGGRRRSPRAAARPSEMSVAFRSAGGSGSPTGGRSGSGRRLRGRCARAARAKSGSGIGTDERSTSVYGMIGRV